MSDYILHERTNVMSKREGGQNDGRNQLGEGF